MDDDGIIQPWEPGYNDPWEPPTDDRGSERLEPPGTRTDEVFGDARAGAPVRPWRFPVFSFPQAVLSTFGITFGTAVLWAGMRGIIIGTGSGFVAIGGPYVIENEAPGWVWVIPVSIFILMISIFWNMPAARVANGWSMVLPGWTLLFGSLGWNFMEFGLNPPMGEGLEWGWIICGVVFFGMALPAAVMFFSGAGKALVGMFETGRPKPPSSYRIAYTVTCTVAALTGIVAGLAVFAAIATT